MMNAKKIKSVLNWSKLLFATLFVLTGCHLATHHVPEGKHWLKKNEINVEGDPLNEEDLNGVIRQQPNIKFGPFRVRLFAYNNTDSLRAVVQGQKRRDRKLKRNEKRLARKERVDQKRIEKARAKGDSLYLPKRVHLADTVDIPLTFKQRRKYKFGEAPVIADTFLLNKSATQLEAYLRSKGYYDGHVSAKFDTITKKRRGQRIDKKKVIAKYELVTGERYYIDSVRLLSSNAKIASDFLNRYLVKIADRTDLNESFRKALVSKEKVHIPFDAMKLDAYRSEVAKYFRDRTFYEFRESNVNFRIDSTTLEKRSMILTIVFSDRLVPNEFIKDSLDVVKHRETQISKVYFHICDTAMFNGSFSDSIQKFGLRLKENNFLVTLDTTVYNELLAKVEDYQAPKKNSKDIQYFKSKVYTNLFGTPKDSIAINKLRIATFTYNGDLFVHEDLIEAQNYLENSNYYKEYYLDRTYTRLVQLGLFVTIKPEIIEKEAGDGFVEVHYYLVPAIKHSFSIEPRANNANGYLGVSTSINYSNKNVLRSGTNLVFSFSGGFESNPSVFQQSTDGSLIKTQSRSFNTFEIGPSIKYDIPGLFPLSVTKLGKRQRPRTIISGAYNYQRRTDFSRGVFQFNYLYKFNIGDGKTQIISAGLPFASVIKFVSLKKEPVFEASINALNNLFLKNAYSDQFIWEDFKASYEYDNLEKEEKRKNLRFIGTATFNYAGLMLDAITDRNPVYDSVGHKTLLGVPYSEFRLLDGKIITYWTVTKYKTLAFRLMAGAGKPGKNSSTSLPYDYSFFGGGANDNRGWLARSLGPGSYSSYLDSNRVATQIGDIRLSSTLEYRISSGGLLNHAFFVDAGNIWTRNFDPNRIGSQFTWKNWYKEIALAVGYGVRFDLEYFIFRLDFGLPIYNPYVPTGSRWIFQTRDAFYDEAFQIYGPNYMTRLSSFQKEIFKMQVHFGIGFPF